MNATVRKRSVLIDGHATSISLEAAFWSALADAAKGRGLSINRLIAEIDRARQPGSGNLSSALRVYLLRQAQQSAAASNGSS
jgi:predicted DNA-binding ribbon-helix-helix protein